MATFVSGLSCQVVGLDSGGARKKGPTRPAFMDESDYDPYTDLEVSDDDDADPGNVEVLEELFGYRRKAGTAKGGDTKGMASRERVMGLELSKKGGGGSKPPKAPKIEKAPYQISIKAMLDVGLFKAGMPNVTVNCKKQSFAASLTREGDIMYNDKVFKNPNAFSMYIKKLNNHHRPGGNGWRSVMVDNLSLEEWWGLMPPGAAAAALAAADAEAPEAKRQKVSTRNSAAATPVQEVASASQGAAGADAAAAGTINWVQCSSCNQWRLVPEACWPMIEASDEQEWFCSAAVWDVTKLEPYTKACGDA